MTRLRACRRTLTTPVHHADHPSAPYQVISQVYQSDNAALQALRQNSQILQPVYSNPELVKESYDGLLAAMGNQADALEIMKQNPAVLTCGGAIAEETPDVRHCGLA